MEVVLDPKAGFCFGVNRAIQSVEKYLDDQDTLYCLGEIVHNQAEVKRLEDMGMKIISREDLKELHDCKVLIRAHGEPPSTYQYAKERNIQLIDATCPIVLKLQDRIRKAWDEMKVVDGRVVIFGKPDHAEIIGLKGQTDNEAIIIESEKDLEKIPVGHPLRMFSQTTKGKDDFKALVKSIEDKEMSNDFLPKDTICGSVSNRVPQLQAFANECDCIIFVSGKNSSNGKALYNVCKSVNKNTYLVSSPEEVKVEFFTDSQKCGVSGATSTPSWLMDQVKQKIESLFL